MSTPCEEIRPELEALLAAMTEGTLDAAAKRRLAGILRDHPDARQFYLEYCQMHALLQSAHGVLQGLGVPSVRPHVRWIAAAAAVVLVVGAVFLIRESSRVDASVALVHGAGWLLRNGQRVAIPLTGEMRAGDRVVTGPDSRTEIRLRDGSRITLLEKTEAEIGAGIRLQEGTVQCDVTPQRSPLVFRTPDAEATVMGTSFELTAAWKETRLRTATGLVRLSADGRSVDVKPGQIGIADAQGVGRWDAVCALDFTSMKELPPQFTTAFCYSDIIHTEARKIESAPERVRLSDRGLTLGATPDMKLKNGLLDLQWKKEVGEDVIIEADVAPGGKWALAISMSGNGFEGYRVFFAAIDAYPNGVAVDTIHPTECIVLARDPRPISYDRDHTVRVERKGARIRAWVDGQVRIDTEITHPLAEGRKRTFSLANFGSAPTIRALRVWKAAP